MSHEEPDQLLHDVAEDYIDEEAGQLQSPVPWWTVQGRPAKLLLCVAIGIILLLACLGMALGSTALVIHHSYEQQIAGNPGNDDVKTTSEYQITFPKSVLTQDREVMVAEWMQFWKQQSFYFSTATQTSTATTLRYQYYIDMTGSSSCNSGSRIRVRVYDQVDSEHEHSTGMTVDIKGDVHSQRGGYNKPFWPNSSFPSEQKLEHDFHECSEKFSRESRVYLDDTNHLFQHCSDISELFPWALKDKYASNKVSEYESQYWWVQEYSGWLANDTRFLIANTLRYNTLDAAKSGGNPAEDGEWSIRLFSLQDGRSNKYNEDVVTDTRDAWKATLDHFGNGECRS